MSPPQDPTADDGRPAPRPLPPAGLAACTVDGEHDVLRRAATMVADHRGSQENHEIAITGRRFDGVSG
jgi:hypothetical protein